MAESATERKKASQIERLILSEGSRTFKTLFAAIVVRSSAFMLLITPVTEGSFLRREGVSPCEK